MRKSIYSQEKECPICKITFMANKYRNQICCSKSCARKLEYQTSHAPAWKGGRIKNSSGYIDIWVGENYPNVKSHGYYLEHRYIMEQYLNRSLEKYETIHHINGDRTDNRIENLQLRTYNHGKGIKLECIDCGSSNIKSVPI